MFGSESYSPFICVSHYTCLPDKCFCDTQTALDFVKSIVVISDSKIENKSRGSWITDENVERTRIEFIVLLHETNKKNNKTSFRSCFQEIFKQSIGEIITS